jgi:long-subunit acyl-CoA synthetase (AMP-forming)
MALARSRSEAPAWSGAVATTPALWGGESMGEVMLRGNIIMNGYLENRPASEKAFVEASAAG